MAQESLSTQLGRGPSTGVAATTTNNDLKNQSTLAGLESFSNELKAFGEQERARKINNDIIIAKTAFAQHKELPGSLSKEAEIAFANMTAVQATQEFTMKHASDMAVTSNTILQDPNMSPLDRQATFDAIQQDSFNRFAGASQFTPLQQAQVGEMLLKTQNALSADFYTANAKDVATQKLAAQSSWVGSTIDNQITNYNEALRKASESTAFDGANGNGELVTLADAFTPQFIDDMKATIHLATPSLAELDVDLMILAKFREIATDPSNPMPELLEVYNKKRSGGKPSFKDVKALIKPIREAQSAAWTAYNSFHTQAAKQDAAKAKALGDAEGREAQLELYKGNATDQFSSVEGYGAYLAEQYPHMSVEEVRAMKNEFDGLLNNPNSGASVVEDVRLFTHQINLGNVKNWSDIKNSEAYDKMSKGQRSQLSEAFHTTQKASKTQISQKIDEVRKQVYNNARGVLGGNLSNIDYRIVNGGFVLIPKAEREAIAYQDSFEKDALALLEDHTSLDTMDAFPKAFATLKEQHLARFDAKKKEEKAETDKKAEAEPPVEEKPIKITGAGSGKPSADIGDSNINNLPIDHTTAKVFPKPSPEIIKEIQESLTKLKALPGLVEVNTAGSHEEPHIIKAPRNLEVPGANFVRKPAFGGREGNAIIRNTEDTSIADRAKQQRSLFHEGFGGKPKEELVGKGKWEPSRTPKEQERIDLANYEREQINAANTKVDKQKAINTANTKVELSKDAPVKGSLRSKDFRYIESKENRWRKTYKAEHVELGGGKKEAFLTIGYGITEAIYKQLTGKTLTKDTVITNQKAQELLKKHIDKKLIPLVEKEFPKLNANQKAAVTSLLVNTGEDNFKYVMTKDASGGALVVGGGATSAGGAFAGLSEGKKVFKLDKAGNKIQTKAYTALLAGDLETFRREAFGKNGFTNGGLLLKRRQEELKLFNTPMLFSSNPIGNLSV